MVEAARICLFGRVESRRRVRKLVKDTHRARAHTLPTPGIVSYEHGYYGKPMSSAAH